MNPNNACTLRITAAAGTELAGASSDGTVKLYGYYPQSFLPNLTELYNPEGLLHSRGVAPSGFPPLRKLLDCCLP